MEIFGKFYYGVFVFGERKLKLCFNYDFKCIFMEDEVSCCIFVYEWLGDIL